MRHSANQLEYFPALDGLRGVAIIMVMLAHHYPSIPFSGFLGSMGVDLFFVLSGFLITTILLTTKGKPGYFRNFFKRRVLRIFPLYYLSVMLFFLFAGRIPALSEQFVYYSDHWQMLIFHLNNIGQVIYPKPALPLMLNHFWSLSLEEQFYLLWPVLIWLIPFHPESNKGRQRRNGLFWLVLAIILCSILCRFFVWLWVKDSYDYWYIATNIRMDCLAIGAGIAALRLFYPEKWTSYYIRFATAVLLSFLSLAILTRVFSTGLPSYTVLGITAFSAICGWLIIACIKSEKTVSLLKFSPLILMGRISYGLYIFHWPVIVLGNLYLLPEVSQFVSEPGLAEIITGTTTAIIATGISLVSYVTYERWFMGYRPLLPGKGTAGY